MYFLRRVRNMCNTTDITTHGEYSICDQDDFGNKRYTYFPSPNMRDDFFEGLDLETQSSGLSHLARTQLELFSPLRKENGILGISDIEDFDVEYLKDISDKVIAVTGQKRQSSLAKAGVLQSVNGILILNPKVVGAQNKELIEYVASIPHVGPRVVDLLKIDGGNRSLPDKHKDSGIDAIEF